MLMSRVSGCLRKNICACFAEKWPLPMQVLTLSWTWIAKADQFSRHKQGFQHLSAMLAIMPFALFTMRKMMQLQ